MSELYYVKPEGRAKLVKYSVDLGNFPIIKKIQDIDFKFKWLNIGTLSTASFMFKENVSYLEENIVPLKEVLWYNTHRAERKAKIIDADFIKKRVILRIYERDLMEDLDWISIKAFTNMNYNCRYRS